MNVEATNIVPQHRKCSQCAKGLGLCQRTESISDTLRRRYYKCASCGDKWQVELRVEFIQLRRFR